MPGEVVEVLGRAPLANRQQIHLLRCGNKLLLVSVTPTGAETLTEITDPMEVDRLAGLCQQAQPGSATAAFRKVLQQFGHEPDDSRRVEDDGFEDDRVGASGIAVRPSSPIVGGQRCLKIGKSTTVAWSAFAAESRQATVPARPAAASRRLNDWHGSRARRTLAWLVVAVAVLGLLSPALGQDVPHGPACRWS